MAQREHARLFCGMLAQANAKGTKLLPTLRNIDQIMIFIESFKSDPQSRKVR